MTPVCLVCGTDTAAWDGQRCSTCGWEVDMCPECGGRGFRGCGAKWHEGKPDLPSPVEAALARRAALEASRPLKPGDVVSIPWQQERYEVVAIDGDELWAKDADGAHLTLAVDTCERVRP